MISFRLKNNRNSNIKISSNDIKNILDKYSDFESVNDISQTINQKSILAFDCELSNVAFTSKTIEELLEGLDIDETEIDEDFFNVVFEDVRAYLKDVADEVESEIQEIYLYDNVRCHFEFYNMGDDFENCKFVFVVSFANIKLNSLSNLTSLIAKKQLKGASKYYS